MKLLEIIIAIILVYAILSMIVTALLEWRSSWKKSRGEMLRQALKQMLDDQPNNKQYQALLYDHPMISSAQNKGARRPAQYIDPEIFANALVDVITWEGLPDENVVITQNLETDDVPEQSSNSANIPLITPVMDQFVNGVTKMNESPLKRMFLNMLSKSDGKLDELKKQIKVWYEGQMDRVNGWYKRKQGNWALLFAFLLALVLNIDSIHLFKVISLDENLRESLVETADKMVVDIQSDTNTSVYVPKIEANIEKLVNKVDEIKIDTNSNIDSSDIVKIKVQLDEALQLLQASNILNTEADKEMIRELNSLINLSYKLGFPMGWTRNSAPYSWWCNPHDSIKKIISLGELDESFAYLSKYGNWSDSLEFRKDLENYELHATAANAKTELGKYFYYRNSSFRDSGDGFTRFLTWILGIFISTLALSRGSHFWFEWMVKFVNIRRAGIKPEDKPK
jgi:hypothetical protein